ncbi:hypothetical protein D5086_022541 [Populus alba]|uniref:Uncharacterized protein n=1 Tax=Populus alba TaxID=43335 RepID=A0ACC4BF98_POPAL
MAVNADEAGDVAVNTGVAVNIDVAGDVAVNAGEAVNAGVASDVAVNTDVAGDVSRLIKIQRLLLSSLASATCCRWLL